MATGSILAELCSDLSSTFPEGTLELVDGVFRTADKFNRNGELAVTELSSYLPGTIYHEFCEWLHNHYAHTDMNKDGVIDRAELTEAAAVYLTEKREDHSDMYDEEDIDEEDVDVSQLAETLDPQELLRIGIAVAHRERAARKDAAAKERSIRQAAAIRRQQCASLENKLCEVSDAASAAREDRDALTEDAKLAGVQLRQSGAPAGSARARSPVRGRHSAASGAISAPVSATQDLEVWLKVMENELASTKQQLHEFRNNHNPVVLYSWHEIVWGTNDFDNDSCIGRGPWGSEHLCQIGCTQVAVKLFSRRSPLYGHLAIGNVPGLLQALGERNSQFALPILGFSVHRNECCVVHPVLRLGTLQDCLSDHLATGGMALNWQQRIVLAHSMASCLSGLHSAGLVHGAFNSSNVMLDPTTHKGFVAEHYLSTLCGGAQNLVKLYASQNMKPSPWCAPELHTDPAALSPRSDMYALGVVLLELLLGRLPSQADDTTTKSLLDIAQQFHGNRALLQVLDMQAGAWDLSAASIVHKAACSCLSTNQHSRPASKEVEHTLDMLLHMDHKKTKHKVLALRGGNSASRSSPLGVSSRTK